MIQDARRVFPVRHPENPEPSAFDNCVPLRIFYAQA